MEQILRTYYENNARRLRGMVDRLLSKFGGLSDLDVDDFYSLANEVFVEVMRRYDGAQPFEGFLYSCLFNKIKTEMTRRNREKRKADRMTISLDMPLGEDEDTTLGETIVGDFTIEREVFDQGREGYSQRTLMYLDRLSGMQKAVLRLHMDGYAPNEIRRKLRISKKQYDDCNAAIHAYRNVSLLI